MKGVRPLHRRFFKRAAAAFLLLLLASLPASAAKRFHILMINDPHSYILPYRELIDDGSGKPFTAYTGGMARALYIVRLEREKISAASDGPVFLFEGGDVMLGLKGSLTAGAAEYGALALLGFDAGVLGNHDFDGGTEPLAKLGPNLKFPVLASNVDIHGEAGHWFAKSAMLEKDGVKVGVFGLVTPDLKSIVGDPSGFDVERDIISCARRYVARLRAEGADAVVAINHIGLPLDRKLASEVPGIDVIVGGHSHDAVAEEIFIDNGRNVTVIGQAGLDGRYAGHFRVTVGEGGLMPSESSWELLPVTRETPAIAEVEEMGRMAQERIAANLSLPNPVFGLDRAVDCTKEAVRTRENALGSEIAEALRWKADARIALLNGGTLRIGRVVPPGPFSASDMLDLIPYDDEVFRLLMTGAQIRRQLEISASSLIAPGDGFNPEFRTSSGEFVQAAGIRFEIDLDGRPAEVVQRELRKDGGRIVNVMVEAEGGRGWEPLDDGKVYSVAATDYMCMKFEYLSKQPCGAAILQAAGEYFRKVRGGRANAETDGRIKITGGGNQSGLR